MYEANYKDLLNAKEKFDAGLIDNYYLHVHVPYREVDNLRWLELVDYVKTFMSECIQKTVNILPEDKVDDIRIETYFDKYIPLEKISKLVQLLDNLHNSLKEDIWIAFEWKCSFIDY